METMASELEKELGKFAKNLLKLRNALTFISCAFDILIYFDIIYLFEKTKS